MKSSKNVFLGTRCVGYTIPQILDTHFKSHSLPSGWPAFVQFSTASARVADEKEKKDVGRPNKKQGTTAVTQTVRINTTVNYLNTTDNSRKILVLNIVFK